MADSSTGGLNKKLAGISYKWWIIGGIGTAGIVYIYFRHSAAAASTPSTTDTTATDDSGIDPSTGIPYSEEYGANVAGPADYSSAYGYDYVGSPTDYGSGYSGSETYTPPVTNNQTWFAQAEAYLSGIGVDAQTASAAIGKYLAGTQLSSDQYSLVQQALGAVGTPPGGAPPVTVAPPSGQTTTKPTLPTIKDGYYRDITTGNIYQVSGNVRRSVSPTTWKRLETSKNKPKVTSVTRIWAGYQLPLAGSE